MKLAKVLIALAIVFSSCSNDQTPVSSNHEVALLLSGKETTVVTAATKGIADLTRVGVYALQTGENAVSLETTPFKNVLYTATGTDGSFVSESPIILESKKTYCVCGYAPFQESTPVDASVISFVHGIDVLYAPSTPVAISGAVASASLSLEHKMSQIRFVLVPGEGSPVLTSATFSATGFNESCLLNLNNGTITPVFGKGASVNHTDQFICFIPDSSSMNLDVKITTADNKVYRGTISRVFKASESYTYTLTVSKTEMGITGDIVAWEPVDGGNYTIHE
jgi:hypothetical protein